MTIDVPTVGSKPKIDADRALGAAAKLWFVVAAAGQWVFVAYIALFYGGAAARGDLDAWNKVFPRGHITGDWVGNSAIATHLLLAVLITLGGQLQLIPRIRARLPVLHRWNGRIYLTSVVISALVGLYLVWGRGGTTGDLPQHLGISLDAVLILLFAGLALRTALARDFGIHRRWALRLFLAANGVWFYRLGLMFWIVVNQGPAGFDPHSFTGPALSFLSFADTLLPLAFLELYVRARDSGDGRVKIAMSGGLVLLTMLTAGGIAAATFLMWLPRI